MQPIFAFFALNMLYSLIFISVLTAEPRLDDQTIIPAVATELTVDSRLSSPLIDVRTADGVVENLGARHAAAEDATNTVGVWQARQDVQVRPQTLSSDAELVKDVRAALTRDPYVERYGVQVVAMKGQIYLTGRVPSLFEKTRAERVAASVPGVISVVNTIRVLAAESQKSDWQIQYDIQQELRHDALLAGAQIAVAVQDGIATLSGTVATAVERSAAMHNAYEGGAQRVRDRLQIKPSAPGS